MKLGNNIVQKIGILVSLVTICTCLSACDSSDYSQAEELFNSGDYVAALELYNSLEDYEDSQVKSQMCQFAIANSYLEEERYEEALNIYQNLGEYEDSSEKATLCEREIGMSTNADYAFLSALEESVLVRMQNSNNPDRAALVTTEFAYLKEFEGKQFYDNSIKELCRLYLKGLYEQDKALDAKFQSDYQVMWQQGIVYRFEALKELHDKYGFMSDNKDFIGTYVMQYDAQKALLDAYLEIEADLAAQFANEDIPVELKISNRRGTIVYTFVNNTKYIYSTVYEFTFLSDDGTIFYNSSTLVENIQPGNSYIVSVYVDGTNCKTQGFRWEWNSYYTEVKLP